MHARYDMHIDCIVILHTVNRRKWWIPLRDADIRHQICKKCQVSARKSAALRSLKYLQRGSG